MSKYTPVALCLLLFLCGSVQAEDGDKPPVSIAVVGLVHGHVYGFIPLLQARSDVQLVGMVETNQELVARYAQHFNLPRRLFFTNLDELFARTNVKAVALFKRNYVQPELFVACAK